MKFDKPKPITETTKMVGPTKHTQMEAQNWV